MNQTCKNEEFLHDKRKKEIEIAEKRGISGPIYPCYGEWVTENLQGHPGSENFVRNLNVIYLLYPQYKSQGQKEEKEKTLYPLLIEISHSS